MGTFDVVDALKNLPLLTYIGVVDLSDRLNFIATCVLLIVGSLVVTFREYLMDPISCYLATNPGGENFLKYVENFCWTEGTMSIVEHHKIPHTDAEWDKFANSRMVYYQWVPFMLLFQCSLFHIPHIIWTFMCSFLTGINLASFMNEDRTLVTINLTQNVDNNSSNHTEEPKMKNDLLNISNSEETKHEKRVSNLSVALLRLFIQHRDYHPNSRYYKVNQTLLKKLKIWPSKRLQSKMSFFYFITKLLYIFNGIGQIFLMQKFLQLDSIRGSYSSWFGIELLNDLITGRHWPQTGAFPRAAYCMVRVTLAGGTRNTQVAQCVLTANMFIEKIYVFLWFWILVVSMIACGSLVLWAFRLLGSVGTNNIRKYLQLQSLDYSSSNDAQGRFCTEFLGRDGLLLIYMISLNRGDVIAGPLVCELYEMWQILDNQKGDDKLWTGALNQTNMIKINYTNLNDAEKLV